MEEVPDTLLLVAVVLAQIQEVEDVRMPMHKVCDEGARPLVVTLVHIPCVAHGEEEAVVALGPGVGSVEDGGEGVSKQLLRQEVTGLDSAVNIHGHPH